MALIGEVLVSVAETELVNGVRVALGGHEGGGGEEEGGDRSEEVVRRHCQSIWYGILQMIKSNGYLLYQYMQSRTPAIIPAPQSSCSNPTDNKNRNDSSSFAEYFGGDGQV